MYIYMHYASIIYETKKGDYVKVSHDFNYFNFLNFYMYNNVLSIMVILCTYIYVYILLLYSLSYVYINNN